MISSLLNHNLLLCLYLLPVFVFKTYNICEEETRMTKFEMLEKAIEGHTIEAAPGTVNILSCLRLLTTVVVVEELINYPRHVF